MSRQLLPTKFDLTPSGKIKDTSEYGEQGYFENVEYGINVHHTEDGLSVHWYGEDDTEISLEKYLKLKKKNNNKK